MRALLAWLALVLALGWPMRAHADAIEAAERALARGRYDEVLARLQPLVRRDRPRALVLAGRVHALRGERSTAEALYRRVIALANRGALDEREADAQWAVAEAAAALGAVRDANERFARTLSLHPERDDIELSWVDLLMEKHALAEAQKGLTRVLAHEPEQARALERLSRIELEHGVDFAAVEARLARALASDPTLVAAHVTRAGLALRDEDVAAADRHLDAALALNPRDLEALSVRAAVRFVADDREGFASAVQRVLRENPRFARLYAIVGTYAEWEHRYAELVTLSEAALAIDPDDASAHTMRGVNLLRLGREAEGRESLARAFRRDPYDEQVFNLLELYERVIDVAYVTREAPPFRVRMARDEEPWLAPYLLPLLARARAALEARYGVALPTPTQIELYARADHFSIRATGLPRLGVQGICFGDVVIALSPRGGEFNWGQILWHELSHVFHVALSRGRVPRWFTEGLAERETALARPEWKREDGRVLYDALARGALPHLATLNHAFTHARSPEQLAIAYSLSALAVGYVEARFGRTSFPRMLALWGEGLSSEQVVERALGIPLRALDEQFRADLRTRLDARYAHDLRFDLAAYGDLAHWRQRSAAPAASLDDHAGLALALALTGELQAARGRAEALLAEAPDHALARFTLAHVALVQGDLPSALRALSALHEAGHDGYQLRMLRARIALAQRAAPEAITELQAAIHIDGDRPEAYALMAEVAERLGDRDRLEQALTRLSFLDQHARGPLLRLLPLLEARGAERELLLQARSALYRDVHAAPVHLALARALAHMGRRDEARIEAERARDLSGGDARRRATALLSELSATQRAERPPRAPARP